MLLERGDVLGQTRFISSRGVPVDQTFIDGFVDERDGRDQQVVAPRFVRRRQRRAQAFDLRSELAPVASIDLVSLCVLPNPLLC